MDLTKTTAIRETLARLEPSAVINAAAYTRVDRAETERDTCFHVNADAVAALASACAELDCPLLQVSTDYVFGADQDRSQPYQETDSPGPINVYGQSKLAGECAAQGWRKHYVVRTCGLFNASAAGPQRGRNFLDTMLVLAQDHRSLRIVHDQTCTPSYVPHVARAMLDLLSTAAYGTYHLTHHGAATWFELAAELFRQAAIRISLSPITTADYGAPAPRPAYSVLDTSKFQTLGCGDLPTWQEGVRCYLNALRLPSSKVSLAA